VEVLAAARPELTASVREGLMVRMREIARILVGLQGVEQVLVGAQRVLSPDRL